MSKSLYALLIGTNHYPNCRPLSGCINDAVAVGAYFPLDGAFLQNIHPTAFYKTKYRQSGVVLNIYDR